MATTATNQETTQINDLIGPRLKVLASKAPIAVAVGGVLCLAGLLLSADTFFQSYLYAYMFWFGITLGSTAWLMGHHVVGGGWGFVLRRPLEAATRTWPLVFAMWFPLLVAAILSMSQDHHHAFYEWANPATVAQDHILKLKAGYLNVPGWALRALLCFAIWFGMAYLLNKWSRQEDESDDPMIRHKLTLYSCWGLILYVLSVTFASIDWVMTIEPHWYSSLFGIIFLVGQGLSTLAVMVVLIKFLAGDVPLVKNLEKRYIRDIGNLMLAFTLLWAYTNFSQFLIQYSANLQEDATWYVHRTSGGWQYLGAANIVLHFALPFLFLLMSMTKVNLNNLAKLAMLLIFVRHLDMFYYVVPTYRFRLDGSYPFAAILADIGVPLLLGGLWMWRWSLEMQKANAPVLPRHDSRLVEAGVLQEAQSHG